MPTVVIRLQHEKTARDGARLLNQIFAGCGAAFVPEMVYRDGHRQFQIRSNIDKQYWDKLCVFCQYRFEREIPAEEREARLAECEQAISTYTQGTEFEDWRSLDGVPAFITLMGLHGVLRPQERRPPDCERAEIEFNTPHPRGTPLVFDGVTVHVELRGPDAKIAMTPYTRAFDVSPYSYGFDVDKEARDYAREGKSLDEFLLEPFGGSPFAKNISRTSRASRTVALSAGIMATGTTLYGIHQGGNWIGGDVGQMIGWIGPSAIAEPWAPSSL